MPLFLIAFLIADLISVAIPFIAYWLYTEWDYYRDTVQDSYAQQCIAGAIALIVFMVLGKFLIRFLLSKRRKGEEQPHIFKAVETEKIRRMDGTVINVELFGPTDGQPLIFIHGLNANLKNWYYQKQFFEKTKRLVMIDLPGMGKSMLPKKRKLTLERMAGDLELVISHLKLKDTILWGHSMGGMTILTFLKSQTNRSLAKAAILEHTSYTNPVCTIMMRGLMKAIQKPILTPLCYIIIALSPIIWISRWMSYLNGTAHIFTRLLTFTGTQTAKQLDFTTLLSAMTPPAVMARGCLAMFKYDAKDSLRNIDIPVLVINANKDRLTQPDASAFMKDHIPGAKCATVKPGNHQALIERHKEVNEAARLFMSELVSSDVEMHNVKQTQERYAYDRYMPGH